MFAHAVRGQIDSPRTPVALDWRFRQCLKRHTMLLSDARQTPPLPANALLPHRSVCSPDLDRRKLPRASERRGHQLESSSNLGSGRHPWRRTGAVGRISGARLEALRRLVGRSHPPSTSAAGPRCTSPRTAPARRRRRCAEETPFFFARRRTLASRVDSILGEPESSDGAGFVGLSEGAGA